MLHRPTPISIWPNSNSQQLRFPVIETITCLLTVFVWCLMNFMLHSIFLFLVAFPLDCSVSSWLAPPVSVLLGWPKIDWRLLRSWARTTGVGRLGSRLSRFKAADRTTYVTRHLTIFRIRSNANVSNHKPTPRLSRPEFVAYHGCAPCKNHPCHRRVLGSSFVVLQVANHRWRGFL